jgi:phosphoglycolate phosphatase
MTEPDDDSLSGYESILFDLDGTLVDTAPDMVGVLEAMQIRHGRIPIAYDLARSNVSNGALGLIRLAFPSSTEAEEKRFHQEYLDRYQQSVCDKSGVYSGLNRLLDQLDTARCPWGIVTNKPQRLTEPLLASLGLNTRITCVISGDTIQERKPHPAPLLLATKKTRIPPEKTIYVGDSARDIEAGKAAGMATVAAAYGYITADDDARRWKADRIAADVEELTTILLKAVNLDD